MKSYLALSLMLVACSSNDGGTPPAQAPDTGVATDNSIKLTMNVKVAPGTEVHRCQFIKLPKSADGGEIFVGARSHNYTPGSHHFLIFRTDLTSIPAELEKQVGCFEGDGVMKHQRGYVHGGQTPTGAEEFPAGVAMAFKSEEVLLMQAHYVTRARTSSTRRSTSRGSRSTGRRSSTAPASPTSTTRSSTCRPSRTRGR